MISLKWLALPLLILILEGWVQAWRRIGPERSEAAVFFWRGVPLVSGAPPPFGNALKAYRADRGGAVRREHESGISVQAFYFEWDDVNAGPVIDAGGHEAEVCNTAAGFQLVRQGKMRGHDFGNGERLEFTVTEFLAPDSRSVWVFKTSWMQGYGTWNKGQLDERDLRLQRSFLRLRGSARVLQGGVFGVADQEEAWDLFAREVLSKVEWSERSGQLKAES